MRRCTVAPALLPDSPDTPTPTPALARSLDGNQLCGIGWHGGGTYTDEGISKLCERLKGSAITSLRCAAP